MLQISEFPSFIELKNIPLYVQTTFHLPTHLSMDCKLGHSYLSATVNAAISIGVQVSL